MRRWSWWWWWWWWGGVWRGVMVVVMTMLMIMMIDGDHRHHHHHHVHHHHVHHRHRNHHRHQRHCHHHHHHHHVHHQDDSQNLVFFCRWESCSLIHYERWVQAFQKKGFLASAPKEEFILWHIRQACQVHSLLFHFGWEPGTTSKDNTPPGREDERACSLGKEVGERIRTWETVRTIWIAQIVPLVIDSTHYYTVQFYQRIASQSSRKRVNEETFLVPDLKSPHHDNHPLCVT